MRMYILDEENHPVAADMDAYARWRKLHPNTHVGDTTIGKVRISTVFLGIDHSWDGPPPVLWETMIFGGKHDEWCERYTTHAAALAGHDQACAMVRDSG